MQRRWAVVFLYPLPFFVFPLHPLRLPFVPSLMDAPLGSLPIPCEAKCSEAESLHRTAVPILEQAERRTNLFVIPRRRPKCLVKQDKIVPNFGANREENKFICYPEAPPKMSNLLDNGTTEYRQGCRSKPSAELCMHNLCRGAARFLAKQNEARRAESLYKTYYSL